MLGRLLEDRSDLSGFTVSDLAAHLSYHHARYEGLDTADRADTFISSWLAGETRPTPL